MVDGLELFFLKSKVDVERGGEVSRRSLENEVLVVNSAASPCFPSRFLFSPSLLANLLAKEQG